MSTLYRRLATAGTHVIKKLNDGAQTKLSQIILTADVQSTVGFSDGTNNFVVDVQPGVNPFCKELVFNPGTDVTLTATGGNVSIFLEVNQK